MKLSIVTTLYNSSPYIEEFTRRILESASGITGDIEFVIVDDGSPDDALDKALKLKSTYRYRAIPAP